jgi:hypothetical protein
MLGMPVFVNLGAKETPRPMSKNVAIEKSYKYLGYFLMLLAPLVIVGFWRTYFSQYPEFKNILKVHHFHAAAASAWIGLLIVQPILIQARQLRWHKIVGKFSYFLFPVLLVSFALMIQMNMSSLQGMFGPTAEVVLLTIFFILAIAYRKQTDKHMRYMILCAIVFIEPSMARLLIPHFGGPKPMWVLITLSTIEAILIGLIIYDYVQRRNYKPYVVGLLSFFVFEIGVYFVYLAD